MQKLIKETLSYLLIVFSVVGCKTPKYNTQNEYLNPTLFTTDKEDVEYIKNLIKDVNLDSIRASTSDFYDIEICSKANKPIFNLEEKKLFSMQITNFGTKELYLPEWFRVNRDFDDVEMKIEIYKNEKQKFEKYIQKRMTTYTHSQPGVNLPKRVVLETKKGKHIPYDNIWIDMHKIIVDEGSYKAKVYIDLSNFGYFKILETEFLFEVKK
jgi:hypothetical protein